MADVEVVKHGVDLLRNSAFVLVVDPLVIFLESTNVATNPTIDSPTTDHAPNLPWFSFLFMHDISNIWIFG